MVDLPGRIQEFLTTASPGGILAAALLSGVVETIFPPFPSEGVLLLASFTGAHRGVEPWKIVVVSALGSFVSLYALYLAGRSPLKDQIRYFLRRWMQGVETRIARFFERYGYGAVLVSRFLPAIRGPLTFLSGVYGLKRLPTGIALGTGCLVWNTLVVFLGYRTGRSWNGSAAGLGTAGLLLAGSTTLLWLLGMAVYRLMSREKN